MASYMKGSRVSRGDFTNFQKAKAKGKPPMKKKTVMVGKRGRSAPMIDGSVQDEMDMRPDANKEGLE